MKPIERGMNLYRLFVPVCALGLLLLAGCPSSSRQKIKRAKPNLNLALDFPVDKGVLFRTYSNQTARLHEGLSIGAPEHTPVRAAQNGKVIYASKVDNNLGKMIVIQHLAPFTTIYGHMDEIHVKVGQNVRKGEPIGTVGTSGQVESPQVYFQLRQDRIPIDPEPYLSSRG